MSEETTLGEFTEEKEGNTSKWQESELEDLLSEMLTGGRPTGGGLEEGEYISIGGTQVNSEGYLDLHDLVYIPKDYFGQVEETQLRKHDILVVKDGANTGDVAVAWKGDDRIVTNEHLFTLRAGSDINSPYLFYFLLSHRGWKQIHGTITGSAQEGINQGFASKVSIEYPPLSEQRKIATVLYNVDQAIQKTEEIIEQTESAKESLMQALFLDGYYEHDETIDAHHRNRLNRHPKEWTTKPAEDVMNVTRGAHPRPKSDDSLWGGDIPIIKISDRDRGDSRTITSTDDMVTKKGSQSSKLVDEGTLIVSNAGTVGAARITGMQTCIHDHWLILRDYEEYLTTRYLYYFINWNQNFLEALASGSTVLDLNTDDFRLFDITFPTLEEQREITDALDSLHDEKIVNSQYADRLRRVKQGLMQDLLSGTVRTTNTNIEVPDEIEQHG